MLSMSRQKKSILNSLGFNSKIKVIFRALCNRDKLEIPLIDTKYSRTHVKEISNTKLLVSLHHNIIDSANLKPFDISGKGRALEIYSFEEKFGSNVFIKLSELKGNIVGSGTCDVSYNARRNILGAILFNGKTAHHLFHIEYNSYKKTYAVKL